MANQIIQGGNGLVNIPVSWSIWVGGGFKYVSFFHSSPQTQKNIHFEIYHYIHVILVLRACFFRPSFQGLLFVFFFSEAGVLIPDLVPKVVMLMASCRCKATKKRTNQREGGNKSEVSNPNRFPANSYNKSR